MLLDAETGKVSALHKSNFGDASAASFVYWVGDRMPERPSLSTLVATRTRLERVGDAIHWR